MGELFLSAGLTKVPRAFFDCVFKIESYNNTRVLKKALLMHKSSEIRLRKEA